ncbi:MAG TPA: hypothetical protein VK909_03060, partial [Anaerolineales bacterium]|nr:hypothetical protein [Anaerolineales bacterium]
MKYGLIIFLLLTVTSCSFPNKTAATPSIPIDDAIATTLASLVTNTPSAPRATVVPTATPFDLKGLFCEYQFCIGHPQDM